MQPLVPFFVSGIKQFKKEIDQIKFNLKQHKQFPSEERKRFNRILDNLHTFIQKEHLPNKAFDLLRSLVTCQSIVHKLEKLKTKIHKVTSQYFFHHKIPKVIVPVLQNKIDEAKRILKNQTRLPIFYGNGLNTLWYEVQQSLRTTADPLRKEKETFHLLLDGEPDEKLKNIDVYSLEGNFEVYAFQSMGMVLEHRASRESYGLTIPEKMLLDIIKKASPTALKTSAVKLNHVKAGKTKDYYKQWKKIYSAWESYRSIRTKIICSGQPSPSEATIFHQMPEKEAKKIQEFASQFSTGVETPYEVIANDIAWDILNLILSITPGHFSIFPAGISGHAVIIEILHLMPTPEFPYGEWVFITHNPGMRLSQYHFEDDIDQNKDVNLKARYTRPMVIRGLTHQAFTYAFIERLVALYISDVPKREDKRQLNEFYQLQIDYLVTLAKGVLVKSDIIYLEHVRGTCSYASLDRFMEIHVSPQIMNALKIAKAEMAMFAQERIVHIRQQNLKQSRKSKASKKRRNLSPFNPATPPKHGKPYRQLNQSIRLYQLSQEIYYRTKSQVIQYGKNP